MHCTNCGTYNEDSYRFCKNCGKPLVKIQQQDSPVSEVGGTEGQPIPVPQPQSKQQAPQQWASTPGGSFAPQMPSAAQVGQAAREYSERSLTALNIRGPFAGFGAKRKHKGWLLEGSGNQSEEVKKAIGKKLDERPIPGVSFIIKTLEAKGVLFERRPYFIFNRDRINLGLKVEHFGEDLFISIVSYLKPQISRIRVIVLGLMVLFWIYMTFIFSNSVENAAMDLLGGINLFGGGNIGESNLGQLICIIGPLGALNNLALAVFVIYSLFKWFTAADLFAGLRSQSNEFYEDDLMAMEKSVEETVQLALKEVELDPEALRPVEPATHRSFF